MSISFRYPIGFGRATANPLRSTNVLAIVIAALSDDWERRYLGLNRAAVDSPAQQQVHGEVCWLKNWYKLLQNTSMQTKISVTPAGPYPLLHQTVSNNFEMDRTLGKNRKKRIK